MSEQFEQKVRQAHEVFKLQWMIDHGFTLTDLIECMEIMLHEDMADSDERSSLQSLFADWKFGVGFVDGSVWPCFEEFLENEYQE